MAAYTDNYNLEKPAQSDLYNVDVFNENADKIDEALGSKAANQSLAPIESSATASRNYSVGQQFVYNGLLYEATSAIASGGTITPGSNCARTTVAEELSALNDSLTNITTFNITTSHTANVSCLAIRHLRIITGRIDITSNVSVWGSVFTVPSVHAANALYTCVLGTDTYSGWFEMSGTNVQSRMSLTRGAAIKFTLIYLSNTDAV